MAMPELSTKMTALLESVGDGLTVEPSDERRDYLGTLKRYGLTVKSRDDEGEHWALTDAGRDYLGAAESDADGTDDGEGTEPEATPEGDTGPENAPETA